MCVLMPAILPGGMPPRGEPRGSGTLLGGGVSEWPKEHASKACEGASPPRVQIPPPPPSSRANARRLGVSRRAFRCPVSVSVSVCRYGHPGRSVVGLTSLVGGRVPEQSADPLCDVAADLSG